MLNTFIRDKRKERNSENKLIEEFYPVDLAMSNKNLQQKLLSNTKSQKNESTTRKLRRPKNESIFTIQCHFCSSFINLLDFKMHNNQVLDDALKFNIQNPSKK
jgi:hypothetical protein